jgi:pyruvate formate lyase activating enzyme
MIEKPTQPLKKTLLNLPIKGLQKTTLIDYPGHIASVIFLGGCNFRCDYCYNKDIVLNPGAIPGLSEASVLEELTKRKNFIDGVVITGGEPTLYSGLRQLIEKIKELGLKVKLDSNGYQPALLQKIIASGLVDYVAMDVKGPLYRYPAITCVPLATERIQESIELLKAGTVDYEFRTTVWKNGFSPEDFDAMFELMRGARAYYLQNMYPVFTIKPAQDYAPMSRQDILPIMKRGKEHVQKIELRGEWY